MTNDTTRDNAQKRYEEARELRTMLERVARDKAPGWRNLEYTLERACEEERLWLGRCIDPVENGTTDEQERLDRH